jgi:K+-transporting ATPase KdpF subunit
VWRPVCGTYYSHSLLSSAFVQRCSMCAAVCASRESAMIENIILLILAAGLMVYLLVCLLQPEKF